MTATPELTLDAALIVGFGAAGRATAKALKSRGFTPSVLDDKPTEAVVQLAAEMAVDLIVAPSEDELERLVGASSVVLPSPGVGDQHRVFDLARTANVAIAGEFDLARLWDTRPIVAITGTNGKTTVTTIVTDALNRSGIKAVAAGNTDVPLVEAIDDDSVETFVVEASSFRLEHAQVFSPSVAGWLNFAPDHLDAHASLDAYRSAKARIWSNLNDGAVVVANAEDPVVLAYAQRAGQELVTFGVRAGTWHWHEDELVGPDGPIVSADELQHNRPHDLANAAAVGALASAGGASTSGIVSALKSYAGLAHRVEKIAARNGVLWINDSKATVPQATLAAVGGYESIVLIAGGRNKGLAMDSLREIVPNVHHVIAMGDAAAEVAQALEGLVKVDLVPDLAAAVARAAAVAQPGDVVLLSPACTSYDQYASYTERGDHFRRLVQEMLT